MQWHRNVPGNVLGKGIKDGAQNMRVTLSLYTICFPCCRRSAKLPRNCGMIDLIPCIPLTEFATFFTGRSCLMRGAHSSPP